MGKRSTKENKNIYQTTRESLDLTRDAASQLMTFMSSDQIEKIESGKKLPHPDEILDMATAYKAPNLCNYYCSNECPIGEKYVPELELKSLSQITLEILASLNSMEEKKNRLIEIAADELISSGEFEDFNTIRDNLDEISVAISSLKLWLEQSIADGKIKPNS